MYYRNVKQNPIKLFISKVMVVRSWEYRKSKLFYVIYTLSQRLQLFSQPCGHPYKPAHNIWPFLRIFGSNPLILSRGLG
jgi:hypothetical protein